MIKLHATTVSCLCLALLLAGACGDSRQVKTSSNICFQVCTKDDDCCDMPPCMHLTSKKCQSGLCITAGCRSDSQCISPGLKCQIDSYSSGDRVFKIGTCVCEKDADCSAGERCGTRKLEYLDQTTVTKVCGKFCDTDADCAADPSGYTKCVTIPTTNGPSFRYFSTRECRPPCTSDGDCTGYHHCVNSGFCGWAYEDDGLQCHTDADCRSDGQNKCINNTCQCDTDKSCQAWAGKTDPLRGASRLVLMDFNRLRRGWHLNWGSGLRLQVPGCGLCSGTGPGEPLLS